MTVRKHQITAAAVLLCLAVTGVVTKVRPAAAASSIEGVVRTLAADTVEHVQADHDGPRHFHGASHDVYRQILVAGNRTYELKGHRAPTNARVRVSGTVEGSEVRAEAVTVLEAAPAGFPATGTTRVLVMLAYWTAPDSLTPAAAAKQMFSDSNGWFRDASYEASGQTGEVTPWMRIAGPEGNRCYGDTNAVMEQSKTAARTLGVPVDSYDNFVVYFPYAGALEGSDCGGYAGWAYVGAPNTWLNGYMDRRVTVHEQGHNYGLWHSHANLCSNVIDGSCTFIEYGDDFDAMGGSGYVGHFSASQKSLLGWMGSRTVDLSGGGSATLAPMATDSAVPHAAVVRASASRTYWLEYRQALDFDDQLPLVATDGIQVRVTGDGSGTWDTGGSLLDLRPGDGLSSHSATLRTGQSWTSPEGLSLSVGAVTGSGAQVRVDRGSPDLVVTGTFWAPATPVAADQVRFSAVIKNQGTGPTPAGIIHGVLFSVDGVPISWSDTWVTSLAPGQSTTVVANGGPSSALWTAKAGSHTVQAFVDDVNRIGSESNESNNTLTKVIKVKAGARR